MEQKHAIPAERDDPRAAQAPEPKWQIVTLVVGLLIGACLGPGVFMLFAYFEPSAHALVSVAIGALVAFGVSLALATIGSYVILPRVFSNARGTVTAIVENLTQASRAHAQGQSDAALAHFGKAVQESAAWYSTVAARRFVVQAALGLLISFGGIVGAVLLLRQNALLAEQNNKIEQQTAIADAQKRGAFVSEMFSILQEVAKEVSKDNRNTRGLSSELVVRIVVLTSSAVPYFYLNHRDEKKRPIPVALSPERGQLALALVRMNVDLASLVKAGATFDYSDLRGFDLTGADFSSTRLYGCDLSFSVLNNAKFVSADLTFAVLRNVRAGHATFSDARFYLSVVERSQFTHTSFDKAKFEGVDITDTDLTVSSFEGTHQRNLEFVNASVSVTGGLPQGIAWPAHIGKGLSEAYKRYSEAATGKKKSSVEATFRFSFKVPDRLPR